MDSFWNGAIKQVLGGVFTECAVPNCTKLSLGVVCTVCSRPVCQSHYFLRPLVPPETICIECIDLELDELRVELGRKRRRKREP